jgi:hypothetical protein
MTAMTHRMKRYFLFFVLSCTTVSSSQTPFSADSALGYLRTIAKDIGPRPMGSSAERRAMGFAMKKFREFGMTDVYLLPMTETSSELGGRTLNTNSGIAVGVLPGESDSIIVIGGHIDSASPEFPGANDDGSGSATVIELARVLAQRKNHSTIIFCLFGGEEQGLCGSKHFVNTFPHMNRVRMMLQADMANGTEWLEPLIDSKQGSTPSWLVSAAFEEMRALGYSTLEYSTHFFTLNNSALGGGIGSDHQPFLDRGIPAIDFTSDIRDPIHSAQDDLAHFIPSGLKRTGDLLYRLVDRFDREIPREASGSYYLLDFFQHPFFIPIWVLALIIGTAFALAGMAILFTRRRRIELDRSVRPKIPALKLFLVSLIIQSSVWLSENVISLLKGVRYPWVSATSWYYLLGLFGALLGIWLALRITPRLRLSRDPYRWYLRAAIWLMVLTIVFAFGGFRLMLYPAVGLLLISASMFVRQPWLKLLLWAVSPHLMTRLIFNEGSEMIGRMVVMMPMSLDLGPSVALHVGLILFFAVWSFPFLLGFAAVWSDMREDVLHLSSFRNFRGLAVAGIPFIAVAIYLLATPSYNADWKQVIRISQAIELPGRSLKGTVQSNEFIGGAICTFNGRDTVFSGRTRSAEIFNTTLTDSTWLNVRRIVTARLDASGGYDLTLYLQMKHRPMQISVTYAGPRGTMKDAATTFAAATGERSLTLRWYSFPDSELTIPIRFATQRPDSVIETIEATFIEPAIPVTIQKDFSTYFNRTTVRRTDTLRAPF